MKTHQIRKLKDADFKVLGEFLGMRLDSGEGVLDRFEELNGAIRCGTGSSQFVYVPGTREDRVVLVAHADTVWDSVNGYGMGKDEGMGADDRAGCAIVWLLKDSGHSLLILNGEESGMLGASYLKNEHEHLFDIINKHRFMVEFDRCNGTDFKTYNVGTKEFDSYIEKMTGYKKQYGSATDICVLCERICGVNLSVGYTDEHSRYEDLNIENWANTLLIAREWLKKEMPEFLLCEKKKNTVHAYAH
jgi:hypothetical protein